MWLSRAVNIPVRPYPGAFVSSAALILPAAVLVAPHLGEAAYLLLTLGGIYALLRRENGKEASQRLKNVQLLSLLTLGFYLVAFTSQFISGPVSTASWNPGGLREFLAAPFIGLWLPGRINTRFLMPAIKVCALLVFAVALYQFLQGTDRPGGAVNPLIFGLLSLLLGFFSLVRLPLESTPEKLLSLAAFSSGCMASVLSQSRATWMMSVFLLACILFVWRRNGQLTRRVALGMSGLFLALALLSSYIPVVQERISSGLKDYHTFNMHDAWNTSFGQRIIMWKGGLLAAREKPVLGWGIANTRSAAASELESPAMKKVVLGYNHLHNEYITNLVAKGLPGLLSVLLLLFVPLTIFLRHRGNPEHLVYQGIGSLLCIGYAFSGLSNQAFGDDTLNIFFVFFLAMTLPRTGFVRGRNKNTTDKSHRIWLLQSHNIGDNNQTLALAESLGHPYETKRIVRRHKGLISRLAWKQLLGVTLAGIDRSRSSPLAPPWPELVISASRTSEMVARWIARRSGGHTRLVHLGSPKGPLEAFDLIIATPQHPLPERSNILVIDLPLHRISPERLHKAAAEWRPAFSHLKRPYTAVLVGGNSGEFILDCNTARRLAQRVNTLSHASGGSVLVTDSARTPPAAYDELVRQLTVPAYIHRWKDSADNNPFHAYLALAEQLVVTAESTSMLVEASATGKPVFMFDFGHEHGHGKNIKAGYWYRMIRHLKRQHCPRDVGSIHQILINCGRARWLHDEAPAEKPGKKPGVIPCGLQRAVARVQRLL